jgi:Undecaprenyl-phosphate glucose phosphotransferase
VGSGHLAHQYVEDIRNNPHLGITIDGYLSDREREELGKHLGKYEDLDRILDEMDPDELVTALEADEMKYIQYVIQCADKEGARLSMIPFYADYMPSHVVMNIVDNTKLIDMRATPLDNVALSSVKRLMDIIVSALGLILLSPLFIVTAVGVKLSSPGPVFFTQERVGLNKRPFQMLKFRSMRVNDESNTAWSTDNDPRKTRFGSFIRKYSIDELPQLINVLRGDMSLVGPRPEIPFYVEQFKETVPLYLIRQQVRPGITGWAQVHDLRGNTSIEARVKYDIWYIENWSLGLDILILARTVFGAKFINSEVISDGK